MSAPPQVKGVRALNRRDADKIAELCNDALGELAMVERVTEGETTASRNIRKMTIAIHRLAIRINLRRSAAATRDLTAKLTDGWLGSTSGGTE